MAQWAKVSGLASSNPEVQKRLVNIYQMHKFSINIRGMLADTIETVDWLSINTHNSESATAAAQMHFGSMLSAMDTKISSLSHDFMRKVQLEQEKETLKDNFSGNLVDFINVMQSCMRDERLLVQSCDPQSDDRHPPEEQAKENPVLNGKIQDLHNALIQAEAELTQFGEHQANFRIEYTTYSEKIQQITTRYHNMQSPVERDKLQKEIEKLKTKQTEGINNNYIKRVNVGRKHEMLANTLAKLLQDVWSEIDTWKNQYKRSFTGLDKPKEGALNIIDSVCLRMNSSLLQLLNQMDKVLRIFNDLKYESPDSPDEWIPKMQLVKDYLEKLVTKNLDKIFLVDKCPRILKVITAKSLGFTMSCRLLGGTALNLQTTPTVTAELHKEADVVTALKNFGKKGMCEVINGKDKPMDIIRSTKQYIGNFNSVQLQKVKQLDKSSDKLVMENCFGMVFYTTLKIRDKAYQLHAYSPPMALISHVLQDCMARAFLIWDAAFSKPDHERIPFEHPPDVAWEHVAKVLDALFKENTGRGLTQEQLNYLGKVAFREKKAGDYSKRKITKSMLIKDRLHKDFSFWKWFYANMNLIKERLKEEWKDGIIHGFISKEEILEKLQVCEPGTFMLRFSERSIENSSRADICGCLTLAVVEEDPDKFFKKIYHVKEHLTPKDIYERGLGVTLEAFEVKDYKTGVKRQLLTYLYPKQEFMKVFSKYIHHTKKDEDDEYRIGKLRIEIFLTEDTDPFPPRDKKITLPMSPISAINSPPDHSQLNIGSPMMSEYDDSQQPFSPEGCPKAIAMVQPSVSTSTTLAQNDLQRMSLNSVAAPPFTDSQYSFPSFSQIDTTTTIAQQMDDQPQIVHTLPPQIENMNLNLFNLAADASETLLNIDSGELTSGGSTGGSGVIMNEEGDMELPENFILSNVRNF